MWIAEECFAKADPTVAIKRYQACQVNPTLSKVAHFTNRSFDWSTSLVFTSTHEYEWASKLFHLLVSATQSAILRHRINHRYHGYKLYTEAFH